MGDFDEYRISTQDLRESDVPGPRAAWDVVAKFALSFDGYKQHGSFARCASIANRRQAAYKKNRSLPDKLDDLRTCLFFEQRRWRHFDLFPDTEAMCYIRAILTGIRRVLRSSRLTPKKRGPVRSTTSSDTSARHRPTRHPGSGARKVVSVYFHDTEGAGEHRWSQDQLLAMIEHHRPDQKEGPDRTFIVGGKREYLAVSTCGPDHFKGQHPLWGDNDKLEGAMMFDDLSLDDVRQILEKFYAGRTAEGCFAPYYGHFKFYVPPKPSTG